MTKKQIEKAFNTILGRDLSDHVEFYQVSRGFKVKYSKKENRVTEISLESQPLDDNHIYSVGLQEYHFNNMADFIGITKEEAEANSPIKVVTTSSGDVLEEAFLGMVLADPKVEGRIVIEY